MIARSFTRFTLASFAAVALAACEDATRPLMPSPAGPGVSTPHFSLDPAAVVDQQNLTAPVTVTTQYDRLGQSFTAGMTGNLTRVSFMIQCVYGSVPDISLMLYAGRWTESSAIGAAFDDAVVNNQALPSSLWNQCGGVLPAPRWVDVDLEYPIFVKAGEEYTFRLMSWPSTLTMAAFPANASNPYAGGESFTNAAWDLPFRTYVVPPVLDQENLASNTSVAFPATSFGQSFTPAISGELKVVSLQVSCGTNLGTVRLRLYRGGLTPGNTEAIGFVPFALATQDASATVPPCTSPSPTWIDFVFIEPASVAVGETYTFRVTPFTPGGTAQFMVSDANPYAGGSTYADPAADAVFRTMVFPREVTTTPDASAPTITPVVTGTLGLNDWYRGAVTVAWRISDGESFVTSSSGCAASSQTTDTEATGVTFTCSATTEGGSAQNSVTIKRDGTPPTLNPSVTPNPVVLNGTATAVAGASDLLSGLWQQFCYPVVTSVLGARTVSCSAFDYAGNFAQVNVPYTVIDAPATFPFTGFFAPVDAAPTLNSTKAGSAVPLKFSLGGDRGLAILAGVPTSQTISCSAAAPIDVVEETVSAGGSGLQYDVVTNTYTYVWKTEKSWAGSCRKLNVKLSDGTDHIALFHFAK